MIFTENRLDDSRIKCYYRTAYHAERYQALLPKERKQLIRFTAGLLCPDVTVEFCRDAAAPHFTVTQTGVLRVQEAALQTDAPLSLYGELFSVLCERLMRQPYRTPSSEKEPLLSLPGLRRKLQEEQGNDLDIVLLHLWLHELFTLNTVYERKQLDLWDLAEQVGAAERLLAAREAARLPMAETEEEEEALTQGLPGLRRG